MTHTRAASGEVPAILPPAPVPPVRAALIDFTPERRRHRRFIGRDDVLAQLDRWLLGPGEAGWVVVTGGPGMGKSAILSGWLARREAAGAVVAHHFVRRQVASWDQPEVIAASLAAQIEARFPELRDPEAKPEGRLIELLGRVSKQLGPSGDLVVLVDGLDETRAEPGDNPLPRFLPHEVPDGIRLLCAMRPTYPHLSWIEARSPARRIDLDDRRWAASNEAVVRGFWQAVAAEYEPPLPAETIAAAIDRADGNVLYAAMLHDALPAPAEVTARRYALRHALVHHVEAGTWADAWCLAADTSFLEAKCRELGVHEVEADVAWAAERCRASGDEALRGRFADLARALGRESHWLRTAPEATAALVWNRLRLSGWSAGDLDQQLRVAAAASFLRVRHVAKRESPALVRDLVGHSSYVLGCAVAADGRRVVSASDDNTLRVWDLATGRALATLEGHADWVRGCAVTPDGQRVISASDDNTLKVWDLATGRALTTLKGHTARVRGCAVTPDGQRVVSASDDQTLKVWDLATGRVLATLEGHTARVLGCAVTPDGQRVVSASADQTLKVWDLDSYTCLFTHRANAGYSAVATTATTIIAGDTTGAVWFLDWPSSNRRERSRPRSHGPDSQRSSSQITRLLR